ncbi:hypothetical protein, partial [Ralstonia pseudosolanacearum]|uniref:hypothetical protein n=1 Tax=Ralstonia pseudosolanacearum TaxID=1310165 RepID=UPI003CF9EC4E
QHESISAQKADPSPDCDLEKIEFRSGEDVERPAREEEKEVDVVGAVQEKLSPKSDPSEEATADKNVTQEVDIKEDEVRTVNNPSKVEAVDKKLVEENEKLREMIGKLLLEGKQQLTAISDLHGRVNDLEKKLTKKKKLKMRKQKPKKQGLRSGV